MKNFIKENQKDFVNSYLQTAAWVTCDVSENQEFTKAARVEVAKICNTFIDRVFAEFPIEVAERLLNTHGIDIPFLAAKDLFMTQNHHGTGFWDSPETYGGKEYTDKLTEIAHSMGEVECYHIRGKKSKLLIE